MRNAASIARGASSEISQPICVLRTRSMLISPSPTDTGSISIEHLAHALVAPLGQAETGTPGSRSARSTGNVMASWTTVATSTPIA